MASPTNELISTGSLRAVADASFCSLVSVGKDRQILPCLLAIWRSQTTEVSVVQDRPIFTCLLALFICDLAIANYRWPNGSMARDRPSPYETRRGVRPCPASVCDQAILPCLFAIGRAQTTEEGTTAWRGTGPRPTKHGVCRPCLASVGDLAVAPTDGRTTAWRGTGPRLTRRSAA